LKTEHDFAFKAGVILASAFCAIVMTLFCWFGYWMVVKLLVRFTLAQIFFGIGIFWYIVIRYLFGKEENNG
jgi:hypothetical protein